MADISKCPKCKKEYELNKDNSRWYDDDENELGEHLWNVSCKCPYCHYHYWQDIWDDFWGEEE